jgi:hypothetical protein
VAVVALAVVGASLSGDDKLAKERPPLPAYYGKLGLRDDQRQQILKLRAGFKAKRDELQRQIDKLKADEKVALETVLTPVQLKRLRELRDIERTPEKPRKATDKGKR